MTTTIFPAPHQLHPDLFYVMKDGQQKLQIWRLDTNAWHPHEDIHHLTPKETRFYCRGEPRAAGFPYSPYFSGQHGQDLLNTVQKLRDKI